MNQDEWRDLDDGDVVRRVGQPYSYMVMGNYHEGGVILVRTILATNRREWELAAKVKGYEKPQGG